MLLRVLIKPHEERQLKLPQVKKRFTIILESMN